MYPKPNNNYFDSRKAAESEENIWHFLIQQLRGVRPFFSEKYDITKHPNYKYLSDYDKKNTFDMEKHLRRRPAIVKPDEVFDYYEVDAAELE